MNDKPMCTQYGIEGIKNQQLFVGSSIVKEQNIRNIQLDEKIAKVLYDVSLKGPVEFFMLRNIHHESNFAHIFMSKQFQSICSDEPYLSSFVTWNNVVSSSSQGDLRELSKFLAKIDKLVIDLIEVSQNEITQALEIVNQQLQNMWNEAQKIFVSYSTDYRPTKKLPTLIIKRKNQSLFDVVSDLIKSELYKDYEKIFITNNEEFCFHIAKYEYQVIDDSELKLIMPLVTKYHDVITILNKLVDIEDMEEFYSNNFSLYQDSILGKLDVEVRALKSQITNLNTENNRLKQENEELNNKLRRLSSIEQPTVTHAEFKPTLSTYQPNLDSKVYNSSNSASSISNVYSKKEPEIGNHHLEEHRKQVEEQAKRATEENRRLEATRKAQEQEARNKERKREQEQRIQTQDVKKKRYWN